MTTINLLNNRTLASIVAEFFAENESASVIVCDRGNGAAWGENGRALDYIPETMSDLLMTEIPVSENRTSEDGFESSVQSDWQYGENGYQWRVRF